MCLSDPAQHQVVLCHRHAMSALALKAGTQGVIVQRMEIMEEVTAVLGAFVFWEPWLIQQMSPSVLETARWDEPL